jgi:hypothetical protein
MKTSCHCGKVSGTISAPLESGMSCNCSICRRRGHLLCFIPAAQFTLETSREAMTLYSFKAHRIQHLFCATCGCSPFAEGTAPDGSKMVAVNLRCVEGIDLKEVKITEFDGASLP